MTTNYSLVLITQDAPTGNLVSTALGHQDEGGETYALPLSSTGSAPATHWACHTWATPEFVAALAACANQTALPPAPWSAVGLSESQVFAFCGGLIWSARTDAVPREHFGDVLAANGLQQITGA